MGRIIAIVILSIFLFKSISAVSWQCTFSPSDVQTIHMHTSATMNLTITGLNRDDMIRDQTRLHVLSDNTKLAEIDKIITAYDVSSSGTWSGDFEIYAQFLGKPNIYVELQTSNGTLIERSDQSLPIIIIREERVIDTVFTGSVATLVAIIYINFGAALDLSKLKGIVRKPIGPAIGFFGQFVIMPVLSYILGLILFPDNPEMQLGIFFTGVSPAGGASNIWTVILGGNMDLSVTMTTISTFAAFGMMPLWIFTLGRAIFDRANLTVPYQSIATYAAALVGPLAIGILITKFLPRVGRILVRILKPFSTLLILFIVIFAIVTNLYLFELFSWQIIVAGMGLPWIGYMLGWIIAKVLRQPPKDSLAIGIETGVQNTGIAIFILRFALDQPEADLTTIAPVSVAIMTPLPLILLYVILKIRECMAARRQPRGSIKKSEQNGGDPALIDADDPTSTRSTDQLT